MGQFLLVSKLSHYTRLILGLWEERGGIWVTNHIGDVMARLDCWFKARAGQTKNLKICICCFSNKHAELRSKSKDWLARN